MNTNVLKKKMKFEKRSKKCHIQLQCKNDIACFSKIKLSNTIGEPVIEEKNKNLYLLNTGNWEKEEHLRFVKACLNHGNNWKKVLLT